ncbi:hypothetical protein ABEV16_00390 [Geobacillus stearothermophilus]|uniref:hypothetical protein n=1 Tax=Geobacillus stearothermophilus TaxID=1422 RepID=UPI003D1E6F64
MYEKQYPNEGAVLFNQPEEKSSYGPMAEQVLKEAIFQFQRKKALHHKVYLTKKDDYDRENQNSIFPFYTTRLFEQHCYHVCL